MSGHKLSREEWESKISMFHAKHKTMAKEEAMMEYMKVSQDLETYGVNYYGVVNKKNTEVLLGIDALQISIYDKNNKLSPTLGFPWSEIDQIKTSRDNKIIVHLRDKTSSKMTMRCDQPKMKHQIYMMVNGNHEMYKRRRRPDPLEVQQMKSERQEEDERRAKERQLLLREMEARERAEQVRLQLEQKYKDMEERMSAKEQEVQEKDDRIRELEEQLRALREAKESLEAQQNELRELMTKLEEDKTLQTAEREKMEEEARAKQEEIDRIKTEVEEKERLARELQVSYNIEILVKIDCNQEEVEASRRKMEETQAMMNNGDVHSEVSTESEVDRSEDIPEIVVDPVDDGREVSQDYSRDSVFME